MHTPSRSVLLAAAAALLALAPAPAEAQLGGLVKKKVGDKIADKVLGEQQGSERRAPEPKFSEDILEITDERFDRLMKGIEAEERVAVSARRAAAEAKIEAQKLRATEEADARAYDAKFAEYERAMDAWERCRGGSMSAAMTSIENDQTLEQAMQRMEAMSEAERKAFDARMEAHQKRAQEAQARGDHAAARKIVAEMDADFKKTIGISFSDMQRAGSRNMQTVMGAQQQSKACGEAPVAPEEPRKADHLYVSVRDSVRLAAQAASGMTAPQYAIMRERVTAWLIHKEKKRPLGAYGFTAPELSVLAQRHGMLRARQDSFLGNDLAGEW